MVIQEHKFVFIHVPRTGGTSFEKLFGAKMTLEPCYKTFTGWSPKYKLWLQHATMKDVINLHESNISDHFKFGFVRNPWDRAVSSFFFLQQYLNRSLNFVDFLLEIGPFKQILGECKDSTWRGDHILPQYNFFFDEDGNQLVDFIGNYELLETHFLHICARIGISSKKLGRYNHVSRSHYSNYYTPYTKDIVKEKYHKDIEYFGYTFHHKK